jgi:retinol-binding protein 3
MPGPLILTAVCFVLGAQSGSPADTIIDTATRQQVISGVLTSLKEAYVFPDTALAMERAVRERARRGAYDRITSARAFAESLTAHLQAVSQDRHLRVRYSPDPIPERRGDGPSPEAEARQREFGRQVNFGFAWIEETAAAAFTFLAGTDALIIDLRRNGGGSPHMVAFVTSYLFGEDTVHLNSLYWRPDNRTDHFYTRKTVPGRRYGGDKPVYVLTSDRTFSGAEEFAYNLQTRKRATIVGDTTGGGAHPGGMRRVTAHFGVWVPSGRAINPITKTNWERVGVRPDIAVAADRALVAAHVAALRGLIAGATEPERKRRLEEVLAEVARTP